MLSIMKLRSRTNFRRISLLVLFIVVSYFFHNLLADFDEEILSAILIIIVFSGLLMYEYSSLFKEDLEKKEYFLNIFFIVFFTIIMFATIYSEPISGNNHYFIENGNIVELTYPDAMYFSAITLTTVGYGDIVPIGIFRLFVIIEIFMGIIYTGTMVYIFTKHLGNNK